MRTVRTKVYKFNELSKTAKEKAIESFYDINMDYDWWDSVYEDFSMFCETIGLTIDTDKTYFRGFSSQGNGAAFTGYINLIEFIDGINKRKYLSHAPNTKEETRFNPSICLVDKRVIDLINRRWIDVNIDIIANDRQYSTKLSFSTNYTYNQCNNYIHIDNELSKLEDWLEEVLNDLTHHLYRLLEKEHEYLTSKEAITETIKANEYEFKKDGTRF